MQLTVQPLHKKTFAPFGEVIELQNAKQQFVINEGLTTRFHDLFTIDIADGRPVVSVFRTKPLPLPHRVTVMERHPLGSQAFLPLGETRFLVLVAATVTPTDPLTAADLSLFITDGKQGVNFYKNTWHHSQVVLNAMSDFLVVDRAGNGDNLIQSPLKDEVWIPLVLKK